MDRRKDERGSAMIIAVTVMLLLSTLSLAVVARTLTGLRSVRQNQDYAAALANADAGVADALFRLDKTGEVLTSFCVGSAPGCTVAAVPQAPGVEYVARVVNAKTINVMSKGLVNGVPHVVQAQLVRKPELPYAIFGHAGVGFNTASKTGGPRCTQAAMPNCPGVVAVNSAYPPRCLNPGGTGGCLASPIEADVATNTKLECNGYDDAAYNFTPVASHHLMYPGGLNVGCPYSPTARGVYDPLPPVLDCPAPAHTPPTPCRGTTYTPLCNVADAAVAPGVYFCDSVLTFKGTVTVGPGTANGGKVEFFVIPPAPSPPPVCLQRATWPKTIGPFFDRLKLVTPRPREGKFQPNPAGAVVNEGGDPTKFRVNIGGTCGNIAHTQSGVGNPDQDRFTGIIYAPTTRLDTNGCPQYWRGAIVVEYFYCNGGGNSLIRYDERVAAVLDKSWTVTNFTEIPTSRFALL